MTVSRACVTVSLVALLSGCQAHGESESSSGAPPAARVEQEVDSSHFKVDRSEQFPLVTAERRDAAPELSVTGVVSADVSRSVPVISLASGRVVELRAQLGDFVEKGKLLLRIQSADISGAFSDYRKAVADEVLARVQLDRARRMYEAEALAKKDLEAAQDVEDKAVVDVETAADHLRVLGLDPNQPATQIVEVVAPVSGVIIEQNVTNAAGVKTLDNSPNLFTIADLSEVWILCDVYENALAGVRVGDAAKIRLNAYPDRILTGHIQNIGAVLDPTIRTAKVRITVANPGLMRVGMFVTATFVGQQREPRALVPATAIMHMHDRAWVYVPAPDGGFERVEVVTGQMVNADMIELVSGIKPGQRVVSNALALQTTVER